MQLITRCLASRRCYSSCRKLLGCSKLLSIQHKVNTVGITSNFNIMRVNNYCDSPNPTEGRRKLKLMDFPHITWPSFIYSFKNMIFTNFIIRPYLDSEFSIADFIEGTKQALEVISTAMKDNNFELLKEWVTPEALAEIKASVEKMPLAQREELSISREDTYFSFPYQIGIIFEEEKRWVEITMCFHVLRGIKEMKAKHESPPLTLGFQSEYQERLQICNYRFIREYTKDMGDSSSWIANVVNHFKPVEQGRRDLM